MVEALFQRIGLAALALLVVSLTAHAGTLRVGLAGTEPFVTMKEGVPSGLSVDIWEKVAGLNAWDYKYTNYPDSEAALTGLLKNEVDIVVADAPITSAGLKELDFSQPYFRSGLQIMITDARPHTIKRMFEDITSFGHLKIFWVLMGIVAVSTLIVFVVEKKHNPDFPKKIHDGVAEAFYLVISVVLTGKSVYKGFAGVTGRLMLVMWTIIGVVTVAFFTSSVTTTMTVERLESNISGPQSLPGKVVGAVADTEAIGYLGHHNIETNVYPTLKDAVDALVKGKIQALVGAAPILQYYDNNNPSVPITEVGPVFSPYNYGFAMPEGSDLRQAVNSALLKLQESGTILDLGRSYFGPVYQP